MTAQCSEQIEELPLGKVSHLVSSFSFELMNAVKREAVWCAAQGTNVEDQAGPYGDLSDVDAMVGTRRVLPVVTQSDLDKAIADGGGMTVWDPEKWNRVKTLANAAAGEGTVELMSSREQPDHKVAVKKLPLKLIRSCPEEFNTEYPNAKERPWTDIAVVKQLNSLRFPCACEHLGVFLGAEEVYIMTSLANRGDLFAWCQRDLNMPGPTREVAMRPIVSQMFAGVCWLHNLGIAHRDLSLENVLLTDNGDNVKQVKIIDFGMASLSRTAFREVRGKRSYQAPEMHGTEVYDTFLADIFAVGVIIYSMAVHYYPWECTKPGKDRSFDFARAKGVETLLQKKRMPCNKKPIAQVFSESFMGLFCGLVEFVPELRCSLGEVCFANSSNQAVNSKSSWLSEGLTPI